jgi:hypothetical protein
VSGSLFSAVSLSLFQLFRNLKTCAAVCWAAVDLLVKALGCTAHGACLSCTRAWLQLPCPVSTPHPHAASESCVQWATPCPISYPCSPTHPFLSCPVPPCSLPTRAVGDTVPINYNNRRYFIDIIEAKPADAISVIETDCNVRAGAGNPTRRAGSGLAAGGRFVCASGAVVHGDGGWGPWCWLAVQGCASSAVPAAGCFKLVSNFQFSEPPVKAQHVSLNV